MTDERTTYYVARWIGNPHQCDDRTHYGPFTFTEAMQCWREWAHTGDALALTDLDYNIIPEQAWPQAETMETERQFGLAYAEWGRTEDADNHSGPVDVAKCCGATVSIPPGDYRAMTDAGIENPDAREYWEGYNSAFEN